MLIKKFVIIGLVLLILLYLMFAFILVDLNPMEWESGSRFALCSIWTIFFLIFAGAAYDVNSR